VLAAEAKKAGFDFIVIIIIINISEKVVVSGVTYRGGYILVVIICQKISITAHAGVL